MPRLPLTRVTLNDVPVNVRLRALGTIKDRTGDAELLTLALFGNDRTYLVSREAAERVLGKQAA